MPTFFGWVKEQDKHGQNWEKHQQEVPLFATVAKTAMQDEEFVKNLRLRRSQLAIMR